MKLPIDDVFDESVSDMQQIANIWLSVTEFTKQNLIKMNDKFLEMVDHALHKSYSSNTILVDEYSF